MKSHRKICSLSYNWKQKVKLLIIIIAENYKNLPMSGIVLSTLYLLPPFNSLHNPTDLSFTDGELEKWEIRDLFKVMCWIWIHFNARISCLNHHSLSLLLLPNSLCSKDIFQNYTDYSTHNVVLIFISNFNSLPTKYTWTMGNFPSKGSMGARQW